MSSYNRCEDKAEPVLAGIGEILWDLLPGGREMGGAPANFAVQARYLGGEGLIVSAVGADAAGNELLEHLAGSGLGRDLVTIDQDHPTGTVEVIFDETGEPAYRIAEGVAWDFIPLNRRLEILPDEVDGVCFGTLAQRARVSRETIRRFVDRLPPRVLRVLDINLRPPWYSREIIAWSLNNCQVLKLNRGELEVLAGIFSLCGDDLGQLRQLRDRFDLRLVALTRGGEGSLLCSETEVSSHPGCAVEVVDPVGAGDAFAAVLATGLILGWDLDLINERANGAAAFVCSRKGALPGLPDEMRVFPGRYPVRGRIDDTKSDAG